MKGNILLLLRGFSCLCKETKNFPSLALKLVKFKLCICGQKKPGKCSSIAADSVAANQSAN